MRRAPSVRLHSEQRRQLTALVRAPTTSPRVRLRTAIVLRAAASTDNVLIARELGTSAATAGLWRRRFLQHGVAGLLRDAPRPGRPPVISNSVVQTVLRTTALGRPPTGASWSARSLSREVGVSKSTVQRIWQSHGIQRHGHRRASPPDNDVAFLEKVTDLVGLYLNPPERAVAFSTDERMRPNPFRQPLAPASDTSRRPSRGAEFRAFLQMTERETPAVLDVHLLVDSRLDPVPPEVERWLSRHPRFHLHFLPPDRVGQTLIDRLIDGFARRKDRPGASASAHRLKYALRQHIRVDAGSLRAFVWTAASGDIRGAYGRRAIQQ